MDKDGRDEYPPKICMIAIEPFEPFLIYPGFGQLCPRNKSTSEEQE